MASALRTLAPAFLAGLLTMPDVAVASNYFLQPTELAERMRRELVEQHQFKELTVLLGHGASHERLAQIEEALRPMYVALPKTDDRGIDQGVARYALSRYFLTHHGWQIAGMGADGERWNASSSTKMLKSKMPSFIFELLEEHVGRKHLGLRELSVLAATAEDVVLSEGLAVLRMAYKVHSFSMDQPLKNREEEELVINTFMFFFTMPWQQSLQNNSRAVRRSLKTIGEENPGWNDEMLWVEDLKQSVKYQRRGEDSPFSKRDVYFGDYPAMVQLAEQIISGYGLFKDIDCKAWKNTLMELEDQERDDGRVRLANFYRPYFKDEGSVFVERPEFLKLLGSLDDSNPMLPRVIVPNWLYGRQFCIGTDNDFQSYCCVDQCNVLMESLERSISHPVAPPGVIAELVADLSSDTVAAPRNLSGSLRLKLDLIAEQHSGHVPLHGRLFAQWLHHAFPNECPQPRAPGATEAAMSHAEWQRSRNTSSYVSRKAMQEVMDRAALTEHAATSGEPEILWTEEEELLTSLDIEKLSRAREESQQGQDGALHSVLCLAAMCAVVASLVGSLLESVRASASLSEPQGLKGAPSHGGTLSLWGSATGKSHSV